MTTQVAKNFTLEELTCKCGCGTAYISKQAISKLQALRDRIGAPLIIVSAARCPKHNWEVGGAPHSQHLSFKARKDNGETYIQESRAFDIRTTEHDQMHMLELAQNVGFGGIGRYDTFLHVDDRGTVARWNLRSDV
jgi:zinc D-Ala-D-Ala carboxypeptidase